MGESTDTTDTDRLVNFEIGFAECAHLRRRNPFQNEVQEDDLVVKHTPEDQRTQRGT